MQEREQSSLSTVGDIAGRAGVSPSTLRRLEAAGVIPPADRTGPQGLRVWSGDRADEVIRLIGQRRAARGAAA